MCFTRFTVVTVVAYFILSIAPNTCSGQTGVEWRVVNAFPFLSDTAFSEIRSVYETLAPENQSPSDLELALQRDPRAGKQGWFSHVALNNHELTCWDSQRVMFRESCKDYLTPAHQVEFRINKTELGGFECEWIPDWTSPQKGRCDEWTKIPKSIRFGQTGHVSMRVVGADAAAETIPVVVKERLVVGLGDSYAAGEGDPDIPATFDDNRTDHDRRIFSSTKYETPKADRFDGPRWLDPRCHRSMYSYQFKTSLQLALSQQHQAVTYISLACSGAVTSEIIRDHQKGTNLREHVKKEIEGMAKDHRYKDVEPQLAALKKLLCPGNEPKLGERCAKQRPIDYLLLSTGGNDVNFGKFVATIVFSKKSWAKHLLSWLHVTKDPTGKTVDAVFDLEKTYQDLNSTLLKDLNITRCSSSGKCPKIILTPYPAPFYNEDGRICEDREVFRVPFGRDGADARLRRVRQMRYVVYAPLHDVQMETNEKEGWTVATGYDAKFLRHGYCAQDQARREDPDEALSIPVWKSEQWQQYDWLSAANVPFALDRFHPYASRARWFRIPIDAKLVIGQGLNLYGIHKDLAFSDETAGIFHPTAQGYAAMADANLGAIRSQERRP